MTRSPSTRNITIWESPGLSRRGSGWWEAAHRAVCEVSPAVVGREEPEPCSTLASAKISTAEAQMQLVQALRQVTLD